MGAGVHAQEVGEGAKQGSRGVKMEGVGIRQWKCRTRDMGGKEGVRVVSEFVVLGGRGNGCGRSLFVLGRRGKGGSRSL